MKRIIVIEFDSLAEMFSSDFMVLTFSPRAREIMAGDFG
jgi:hypothetical protein